MTIPPRSFETELSITIDDYESGKSEIKIFDLKKMTTEELYQIFTYIPQAIDEIAYRSLYLDAKNHNTNS